MSEEPKQESQHIQNSNKKQQQKTDKSQNQNQLELVKAQLKQKLKENKILTTKNSKLETKYVELFRQHKLLKKDHSNLVSVIKHVLPEQGQKTLGSYDSEQMIQKIIIKQSQSSEKINQMISEASHEKIQLQRRIKEEMEEKIKNADAQSKTYLEELNKELESFKKNNKTLSQQIIDLDKRLDSKNNEVSKLTKEKLKLQHQINQLKLKEITSELDDNMKNDNNDKSNSNNQLLALRQQIDALLIKRDELRKQLKNSKEDVSNLESQLNQKNKKIMSMEQQINSVLEKCGKYQQMISKEKQQPKEQKAKQKYIEVHENQDMDNKAHENNYHHLTTNEDYVHRQYVKNIFIRYMKCYGGGDYTQAEILLNILLTILKFSVNEREHMLIKKRGWFGFY